jgi:hypothetical protein
MAIPKFVFMGGRKPQKPKLLKTNFFYIFA